MGSKIERTGGYKTVSFGRHNKVKVRQIVATEDIILNVPDDEDAKELLIKKGQKGGFVSDDVELGENAWLNSGVIAVSSKIDGIIFSGYGRIEDSVISSDAFISGRGTHIADTFIGNGVRIYGRNELTRTTIYSGATLIGSIILRDCKVDEGTNMSYSDVRTNDHIGQFAPA